MSSRMRCRRFGAGVSAIETLVGLPLAMLVGLCALQFALVLQGRLAVAHAAREGARSGALENASMEAIDRGIARGLTPWVHGSSGLADLEVARLNTQAHLSWGRASGWSDRSIVSPTRESFEDWAQPARDASGNPIADQREIPNDNLAMRSATLMPASGVAGWRHEAPIGQVSGQTLSDANLLKIELRYGVALSVPLAGPLAAWIMQQWDGCPSPQSSLRIGLMNPGNVSVTAPRAWTCAYYAAKRADGRAQARWPVVASATVRMQSAAREAGSAIESSRSSPSGPAGSMDSPSLSPALQGIAGDGGADAGVVDAAQSFLPLPVSAINTAGATAGTDGSADRSGGFLKLGSATLPIVGSCATP